MNYFEKLMNTQGANIERKNLISDYTYLYFKKFVDEMLPKLIEQAFNEGHFDITFSITKEKGILSLCGNKIPREININELLVYINNIPGLYAKRPEYNCFSFEIDLEDAIKYYYEELQREEYLNQGR